MGYKKLSFIKNIGLIILGLGFVVGLILFLDEIHMIFPFLIDYGIKGGFLGDLSQYHIEGFHHWQFGVLLMLVCCVGFYILKKSNKKP